MNHVPTPVALFYILLFPVFIIFITAHSSSQSLMHILFFCVILPFYFAHILIKGDPVCLFII
jgi:hypothetical protein